MLSKIAKLEQEITEANRQLADVQSSLALSTVSTNQTITKNQKSAGEGKILVATTTH